jgi:hypothetical protein
MAPPKLTKSTKTGAVNKKNSSKANKHKNKKQNSNNEPISPPIEAKNPGKKLGMMIQVMTHGACLKLQKLSRIVSV